MPARQPVPASAAKPASVWLRNFKAKLPLLRRPAVWASGLLLLLPLIFLANYLRQPAKLALDAGSLDTGSSDPAESSRSDAFPLSDPSSLLEASASDAPPAEAGATASTLQTDLLSALLASSPDAAESAKSAPPLQLAPASDSSQSLKPASPQILSSQNAAPFNILSLGALPEAALSPAASSLQSALDRSAGVAPSSSNPLTAQLQGEAAQAPQNSQTAGRARSNADVTQLYGQQLGQFSQLEQPYRPATSPQAGSTGYVVPPVLSYPNAGFPQSQLPNQFPSQLPNQFPNQFSSPPLGSYSSYSSPTSPTSPTNLGAYPQPTFASPQPLVQPAPFSVPRTPPGRFIGNGQINTFSNP